MTGITPIAGAIDIIAVRQPDGSLKSTPFHVRFGRLQVVRPRDKVVTVRVNGVEVALKMKLGRSGEAYFVHEADVSDEGELDSDLAVSPIQSPVRCFSRLLPDGAPQRQPRRVASVSAFALTGRCLWTVTASFIAVGLEPRNERGRDASGGR